MYRMYVALLAHGRGTSGEGQVFFRKGGIVFLWYATPVQDPGSCFRLFASPEVRNTATYDERTERVQSDEKIEGSNTSTYD